MTSADNTTWNLLIRYAHLFIEQVDLESEERKYKLDVAQKVSTARVQCDENQMVWKESLRGALKDANWLHWTVRDRFGKELATEGSFISDAVRELWSHDQFHVGQLDAFVRALNKPSGGDKYTPGDALSVGALIGGANTAEEYPPFKSEVVGRFLRLIGEQPLKAASQPSERYQQFLTALDTFIARANLEGLDLRDRLDAQGLMWTLLSIEPASTWPTAEAEAFSVWRGDKQFPSERVYVRGPGKSPKTEAAAWRILGPALLGGDSPIDGVTQTWTDEAASHLLLMRESQDTSESGGYLNRLGVQLAGSSNEVYLLAAELTYLQCVALSNTGAAKKIERINTILAWSPAGPMTLPHELASSLASPGSFNGGQGFNMHIAAHIGWLLRFVKHVRGLSQLDLDVAMSSPWDWMELTAAVPDDVPAIRYTIDYFLWPNYLQPIVVKEDRKKVRDTFVHLLGGPRGTTEIEIAKDLHDIRQIHDGESGVYTEWYWEPYKSQWQNFNGTAQKAWLVRQSQAGNPMAEIWQAESIVTLPAQTPGPDIIGQNFESVLSAVKEVYGHINLADQKDKAKELHRFASQMNAGDLVIVPWEEVLLVGTVDSDAYAGDFQGNKLCRTVDWHPAPVPNADLPAPLPRLLGEPGGIVDVTEAMLAIETWRKRPVSEQGEGLGTSETSTPKPRMDVEPRLKNVSAELAAKLHVEREELQEMIELLRTRRQIVLYGPPGTGKTFIGKHLAHYLAGTEHAEHVQIVQFHPSYSYEDFFEGFRPSTTANGQVGFELQPGPLRRLAKLASQPGNEDKPFFLLIDEMNRGNLAKVFGELYFLLEYRKDSIRLQYSPDVDFTLPQNLYIIGTMNTADRSIAMVDAAIRRRFAFVELHPQNGMVKEVLGRFLSMNGRPVLAADLLTALNLELGSDKRDLAVGPSYFMKEDAVDADGLRRVWKYELLPLLEEYHFGELDREQVHERFSLDALLSGMGRSLDELQPAGDAEGD